MNRKTFFDFAYLDYCVAKNNPIDPFFYDSTVCLLTQCIEKMLKGFMEINFGEKPGKVHKLNTLARQLQTEPGFEFLVNERYILTVLQDSYFDRRYPSENYYVLDKEDFEDLTSNAYRVIDLLKSKLSNGEFGTSQHTTRRLDL